MKNEIFEMAHGDGHLEYFSEVFFEVFSETHSPQCSQTLLLLPPLPPRPPPHPCPRTPAPPGSWSLDPAWLHDLGSNAGNIAGNNLFWLGLAAYLVYLLTTLSHDYVKIKEMKLNAFAMASKSFQRSLNLAYLLQERKIKTLPLVWLNTEEKTTAEKIVKGDVNLVVVPFGWVRPYLSAKDKESSGDN
ncbi:hypothetical protein PEBR_27296 [Penicillium brasilianum]|uniref:Uncharacterized protein n=1 Tax=Penicillium brasilianum TaxID=104259 RepID=A0A1S9RV78_PENBI|nr:hypothetical protein PEBR_27296 [Penicillium brasilianum]